MTRGVGNERNLVHLVEKASWNHEKSKQISLKSNSEISPTLQPHPLLQRMTSFLREITGKSRRNLEISYAKIASCQPLVQIVFLSSSDGLLQICVTLSRWFLHKTAAFFTEQCTSPSLFSRFEVTRGDLNRSLRSYGFLYDAIFLHMYACIRIT